MRTFEIGDTVSCNEIICFSDGTCHLPKIKYVVAEDNVHYFNNANNAKNYFVVKKSSHHKDS